mgnify:FL=1
MTFEQYIDRFNIRLDDRQAEAVKCDNLCLLLAVPGSGKTTTLVARLGYMIYVKGIRPKHILTVTYTNAATRDMKDRFEKYFGGEYSDAVTFKTINSLCNEIIGYYTYITGGSSFELIEDNLSAIREIYISQTGNWPDEADLKEIQQQITYIKNMLRDKKQIKAITVTEDKISIENIYEQYCSRLSENRLMDFDDQMVFAFRILRKNSRVREYFKNRYRYLLVDEAQDTSKIQHYIIQMLAHGRNQLFMVGDEDQSIYGFRAAYPRALMEFEKTYKGGQVMLLETDYRSDGYIVKAAARFIKHNQNRYEKKMLPAKPETKPVTIDSMEKRQQQYGMVINYLRSIYSGRQTAILYRNNDSALPYLYRLKKEGIPYNCKGMETTFFTGRTVRYITDLIKLSYDMGNTELFMSTYSKTGCYITKKMAETAVNMYENGRSREGIWNCLELLVKEGSRSRDIKAAASYIRKLKTMSAPEVLETIEFLIAGKRSIDTEKMYILKCLAAEDMSAEEFLNMLEELKYDIENKAPDYGADVILSTIHSAKGLEYDNVIIADAIDGILPGAEADVEEERRLFYVGLTRARESMMILKYSDCYMPFVYLMEKILRKTQPGKAANETFINADVKAGEVIIHKSIGKGTVTAVDGDIITVKFNGGSRNFSYGFCIKQGLIWKEK